MYKRITLISLNLTILTYNKFIDSIVDPIILGKIESNYTCFANVHMLIEAHNDTKFAKVVNNAKFCVTDGVPLLKAINWLYNMNQERIAGMDILPDLLSISEKKGIPVYFYGGTNEMLESTIEYCSKNYPSLLIAGVCSPPFRKLTTQEDQQVINKINQSGAKIVFVALGCPKQEIWMSNMTNKINASMLGIGGALPVMIGIQNRAPKWMQKYSLEWLYRLIQEPNRLWKRYFYTNTLFILLLTKDFILVKILGRKIKINN